MLDSTAALQVTGTLGLLAYLSSSTTNAPVLLTVDDYARHDPVAPAAVSPVQGIATIPEFLWELSLGIYLTVRGFRPQAPCSPSSPGGREELSVTRCG